MTLHAPRFHAPVLPELDAADLSDLLAGDLRDAERFTDDSLSGRTLPDLTFSECAFEGLALDEFVGRGIRLTDCTLTAATGAAVSVPSSSMRTVDVSQSRIGSFEAYDSGWNQVRFTGCKLGYVNLRGSSLTDIVFDDCQIDELDMGSSRLTRVSMSGCRVSTLDVSGATLAHVDLRGLDLSRIVGVDSLAGAVIDEDQLMQFAPFLAAQLGLTVM